MSNVSRKAASVWIPLRNAIEDKCMYWVCRRECTLRILLAFVGELIVLIEILISVVESTLDIVERNRETDSIIEVYVTLIEGEPSN